MQLLSLLKIIPQVVLLFWAKLLSMTMIAGYKESGTPILLGDVLLTGQDGWKGVRKKIHRMSANFVVAWTGHLYAAQTVINDLHRFCSGRRVSKAEVENFFTTYPTVDLGSLEVHIIGWVIDLVPHCFLWNSAWPHQLFYEAFHYDGSGAPLLEQAVWIGSESGSSPSGKPDVPCAKRRVTDLIGLLLAEEALGNDLQQFGFGHAYEFLYFSDTGFEYMPQTLVSVLEFQMTQEGRMSHAELNDITYKIQTISDETFVEVHTATSNTTHVELIANLWTKDPMEIDGVRNYLQDLQHKFTTSSGYKFSYESAYYSFILQFKELGKSHTSVNFPVIPMSFENGAGGEYFSVKESEDEVSLSFNQDFIEFIEEGYRHIYKELK